MERNPLTTASSSATLVEHFRQGQLAMSSATASYPPSPYPPAPTAVNGDSAITALAARLDAIEFNQSRLADELAALRAQLSFSHSGSTTVNVSEVEEEPRVNGAGAVHEKESSDGGNTLEKTVEELAKKVDGLAETLRVDQTRLYARLRNSLATNKTVLVAPPMANGKTPANFPGTKGEFECMTKERYEHLLKSYDQPIKGDTKVKREAIRQFLGIPPDALNLKG